MKYKVIGHQYRNDQCLVCGWDNPLGLDVEFWELENGELATLATLKPNHQSYPGRAHGGIISALLDELIGRAVCIQEPLSWGVTVDLSIKYKKPVPLEQQLIAVGRITRNRSRMFEGAGEIYLPDGTLLASAEGRYMKLPVNKIVESETPISDMNWRLLDIEPEETPEYIELPY